MLHLRKAYSSPFVLDKGKLARISAVMQNAMSTKPGAYATYEVTLKTGRRMSFTSVDDVLALDNRVTDPITALEIESGAASANASVKFTSADLGNISFTIYGGDNKSANELYGELDEQVDRTRVRTLMARVASPFGRAMVTGALIGAIVFALFAFQSAESKRHPDKALLRRAQTAHTDHDKLQIVFEKTVRDLEADATVGENPGLKPAFTFRTLFIVLPAILVIVVFTYLLWSCYPWAVFSWGDAERKYSDVVERRRMLWTVVVIAIILGIVSNLFVASLPVFK